MPKLCTVGEKFDKIFNIFKNDPQIIKNEYLYAERRNDMY